MSRRAPQTAYLTVPLYVRASKIKPNKRRKNIEKNP